MHKRLSDDIKNNKKESAKTIGDIASFIRKNASEDIMKNLNIKEIYK